MTLNRCVFVDLPRHLKLLHCSIGSFVRVQPAGSLSTNEKWPRFVSRDQLVLYVEELLKQWVKADCSLILKNGFWVTSLEECIEIDGATEHGMASVLRVAIIYNCLYAYCPVLW